MTKKEQLFVDTVWDFYNKNGRHHLPWRKSFDPYHVLVSELMLQQTQVQRVIPKFESFIEKWPTVTDLSKASLADVLRYWQGLGYNRRAKFLHATAGVITESGNGQFPESEEKLLMLPGVGPYTAGAILVFAYNQPHVLIETNVRQVFIHHFFTSQENIDDKELLPLIAKTLPTKRSREWYAALMDYGSYLKQVHGNVAQKSAHYKKQSAFKGSNREVRGAILRTLTDTAYKEEELVRTLQFPRSKVTAQLEALQREGLITKDSEKIQLAT